MLQKKKRATFSGPRTLLSTKSVSWVFVIWHNGDCQGKYIERKDYNEKRTIKEEDVMLKKGWDFIKENVAAIVTVITAILTVVYAALRLCMRTWNTSLEVDTFGVEDILLIQLGRMQKKFKNISKTNWKKIGNTTKWHWKSILTRLRVSQ